MTRSIHTLCTGLRDTSVVVPPSAQTLLRKDLQPRNIDITGLHSCILRVLSSARHQWCISFSAKPFSLSQHSSANQVQDRSGG